MTTDILKKEFLPLLAPEDFFVLLAHATKKPKEFLLAHPEYELDTEMEIRIKEYFARRLRHEPVAYITGEKEFFGLPFRVTRDTLIPRPETELLVEQAIEECELKIKEYKPGSTRKIFIADIGTGSGAIIISIAHRLKANDSQFTLHATDISRAALDIAEENAKRNGLDSIISFHHGNLIEPIKKLFDAASDIILIANLPYLSDTLYASATSDVRDYEPESALVSGEDGLNHYRSLFEMVAPLTASKKNISLLCEISPEQSAPATELAEECFPAGAATILPDLSGQARVLSISLK